MDKKTIVHGMQALSLVDPDVKRALLAVGPPETRMHSSGFEAFLFTIVSQQLSTKVAMVIMPRLVSLMKTITPERLIEIDAQSLRDIGLSYRKIEYAKGLSGAVLSGSFDINGL